jgi:Lon protease-like protein
MSHKLPVPDNFSGTARLFPLPNVVVFPHVIQPLHIFEPRYRQMTSDALAGDRMIALALLEPGWEEEYELRPPICPHACLTRIIADQKLADGRYHLVIRGLSRIRIVTEDPPGTKLYRTARVELLNDSGEMTSAVAKDLRSRLAVQITRWLPQEKSVVEQFQSLLVGDLTPGMLCDIFAFALPLPIPTKQGLLEELDVSERARKLLDHLENNAATESTGAEERRFPPPFSEN